MSLIDKRILRVSQALVLASGAPIGWMIIQSAGGVDLYQSMRNDSLVYWYMFFGSALTFAGFGLYVGNNEMKLESMAITDVQTSLHNERFLQQRLPEEYARIIRLRQYVSLLYVSLDHFSDINSLYGRKVSTSALRKIATAMRARSRKDEIIARVGAAEFCILLTDCNEQQATTAAERFLACICDTSFAVEKEKYINVTASIGVVSSQTNTGDEWHLYALAETAMYHAKREGRNRVAVYNAD